MSTIYFGGLLCWVGRCCSNVTCSLYFRCAVHEVTQKRTPGSISNRRKDLKHQIGIGESVKIGFQITCISNIMTIPKPKSPLVAVARTPSCNRPHEGHTASTSGGSLTDRIFGAMGAQAGSTEGHTHVPLPTPSSSSVDVDILLFLFSLLWVAVELLQT